MNLNYKILINVHLSVDDYILNALSKNNKYKLSSTLKLPIKFDAFLNVENARWCVESKTKEYEF
jgi:hypothetical protein